MAWWEAPLLSLAACIVARRFQLVFIIIWTVDFVTWWQSFFVTSSVAATRLVSLAGFSIAALVSNHKCSMNLTLPYFYLEHSQQHGWRQQYCSVKQNVLYGLDWVAKVVEVVVAHLPLATDEDLPASNCYSIVVCSSFHC